MFNDDQVIEYERLYSSLDRQSIIAFAQHKAATVGYQVGRSVHLMAVGSLAAKYVNVLYPDSDIVEKRYRHRTCEAAGFLHETMLQACTFEDIVTLADEAVARMVAAMTPDIREPAPKRIRLLANQIGLADRDAQVVMLADIRHDYDRYLKIAESDLESSLAWCGDAMSLLSHLRKLNETPLHSRVKLLRDDLLAMDRRLKILRRTL